MTKDELIAELNRLGVTPPGALRASLYLYELQATYDCFRKTLAGDPKYAPVKAALEDPELLNMLSNILDPFVVDAVSVDLMQRANPAQVASFEQYYQNYILDEIEFPAIKDDPFYMTTFYKLYPGTRRLVKALGNNFRMNIKEACERVIRDWSKIEKVFIPESVFLRELMKIRSSGSDFHKGGKQVLLLTFSIQRWEASHDIATTFPLTFDLVYKPGDLEADCLIAGNSAAVNKVHPNFQSQSLFEMLNSLIKQEQQKNPNLQLEELPTYKILPITYGSSFEMNTEILPVRTSYGYLEFLGHVHHEGTTFGNHRYGYSDYKIFPEQDKDQICRRFYRIIGEFIAIACTFSILDLHVENIIVKSYTPYLIDMEICLSTLVENISDTSLFGLMGGVEEHGGALRYRYEEDEKEVNNLLITAKGYDEPQQNRLYTMEPEELVSPAEYASEICQSLRDMFYILGIGNFASWFSRLDRVVVRHVPLATKYFLTILSDIADTVDRRVSLIRGDLFKQWSENKNLDPIFLALRDEYVLDDLKNADVPIFYHRIGTKDIMDSRGKKVSISSLITYRKNFDSDLIKEYINIGRNSYFSEYPTKDRIQDRQLGTINNPIPIKYRIDGLIKQILERLGKEVDGIASILLFQ